MNRSRCIPVAIVFLIGVASPAIAQLQVGDTAIVVRPNAELKAGDNTIAELQRGQKVMVRQVEEAWIGCQVVRDGLLGTIKTDTSGWLQKSDLALDWYSVVVGSLGQPCNRRSDVPENGLPGVDGRASPTLGCATGWLARDPRFVRTPGPAWPDRRRHLNSTARSRNRQTRVAVRRPGTSEDIPVPPWCLATANGRHPD